MQHTIPQNITLKATKYTSNTANILANTTHNTTTYYWIYKIEQNTNNKSSSTIIHTTKQYNKIPSRTNNTKITRTTTKYKRIQH